MFYSYEQWPKPYLFAIYRGFYFPVMSGLLFNKPFSYKDPYELNNRYFMEPKRVFFLAHMVKSWECPWPIVKWFVHFCRLSPYEISVQNNIADQQKLVNPRWGLSIFINFTSLIHIQNVFSSKEGYGTCIDINLQSTSGWNSEVFCFFPYHIQIKILTQAAQPIFFFCFHLSSLWDWRKTNQCPTKAMTSQGSKHRI